MHWETLTDYSDHQKCNSILCISVYHSISLTTTFFRSGATSTDPGELCRMRFSNLRLFEVFCKWFNATAFLIALGTFLSRTIRFISGICEYRLFKASRSLSFLSFLPAWTARLFEASIFQILTLVSSLPLEYEGTWPKSYGHLPLRAKRASEETPTAKTLCMRFVW